MSENLIRKFFESSPLAGGNADYVESVYEAWLDNPDAVPETWRRYFDQLPAASAAETPHSAVIARIEAAQKRRPGQRAAVPVSDEHARKQAGVLRLLTAYRSRGHLSADLDPLGLAEKHSPPDLDLPFHGLSDKDLDTEFDTGTYGGGDRLKLRDLWARLKATYTATVGAEFMHISDHEQRRWIYSRLEKAAGDSGLNQDERLRVLERLTAAEGLERYLHTKYVGQKRFSLEGGDSLIPMLDEVIRRGGANGLRELVIGMAHRGRLNVLVNTLGKPPLQLFDEFEGKFEHPDDPDRTGDVKYHMGFSADVKTGGHTVHLALAFNPSHLEIVDPVVVGSVRARQTRRHDEDSDRIIPLLIHGDAAFAGQGVVFETLQMSQARGFAVGGTIHVVINNQVGFTISDPRDARSTMYCTDVAKMVNAPVFHVNGDDPEAVLQVTRLAYDFRQRFKKDVVIDLVCYRRNGHNEADEPAATQPLMYQIIRKRPTPRALYAERLQKAGLIDGDKAQAVVDAYRKQLEDGKPVADIDPDARGGTTFEWSNHLEGSLDEQVDTALERKTMTRLLEVILKIPQDFTLHSRVAKIYQAREAMAAGEQPVDWGFAENLAYAGLIGDGYGLRLVGQDTGRGTFFHRHAVLHDQKTARTALPLADVDPEQSVSVIDSLLSEEGVMGFEYGYATADPNTLVIWEGQFGDFANGAQVVIDQFISAGEAKWGRMCGLALFLPHGYEGQGPEHSSARLERYLQLCALNNMQVCVPTTPAQAFHMIRRQMLRKVRKPLIVMTPKSLLRHKLAVSSLDELTSGQFQNVIADSRIQAVDKVKRVVLCSGRVYYDLFEQAEKDGIDDVALVRVEQLYPFPRELVKAELARFGHAREVIWCQEEPMNQGAWFQIRHHLQACVEDKYTLSYAGRARSPAPACGHFNQHVAEQKALVAQSLTQPIDQAHVAE